MSSSKNYCKSLEIQNESLNMQIVINQLTITNLQDANYCLKGIIAKQNDALKEAIKCTCAKPWPQIEEAIKLGQEALK